MTFSLRSILLVIAVVGIWLGAVLSKSLLAVELAVAATNLGLLLSVALAIWHPQVEQRKFWTGFCLLGIGNFVLANYFAAYQNTSAIIARAVAGDVPVQVVPAQSGGWGTAGNVVPDYAFQLVSQASSTFANPYAYPSGYAPAGAFANVHHHQAIRTSVAPILSLLVACLGGWLTLWISQTRRPAGSSSLVDEVRLP